MLICKHSLVVLLIGITVLLPSLGSDIGTRIVEAKYNHTCTFASQRVHCGSLICNATTLRCDYCTTDDQCASDVEECIEGRCTLRSFLDNFDLETVLAVTLAIVTCGIAVVAGVGGGGILVPMFVALLGLYMSDAVALSQATIAGQSCFNLVFILRRHHPDFSGPHEATRPVINYEYLSLLLPISLIGTMYGALLGKVIPDWLRVVLLMGLLGVLSVRVVKKAITQYRREGTRSITRSADQGQDGSELKDNAEATSTPPPQLVLRKQAKHDVMAAGGATPNGTTKAEVFSETESSAAYPKNNAGNQQRQPSQLDLHGDQPGSGSPQGKPQGTSIDFSSMASNGKGKEELEEDDELVDLTQDHPTEGLPQFPKKEILLCATMFSVLLGCNAAREIYTGCGTKEYFFFNALSTVVLLLIFCFVYIGLRRRWVLIRSGVVLDDLPFTWSTLTTIVIPGLAVTAGAAAALLGIGGGLVLSALLFEAKLNPESASATSSVATLLVAFESALQFLLMDTLRIDYGIMFFFVGVVASCVGQFGLVRPIRQHKWNSMILFALAFVLIGSMISLSALGIWKTHETMRRHGSLGFGELCR
jgi:uncharacterized membrane protein YfcA